jgi:hypothetical protein
MIVPAIRRVQGGSQVVAQCRRHFLMTASLRTGNGAAAPSLLAAYSPTLAVITRPAAGTISCDGNHDLAEMLV